MIVFEYWIYNLKLIQNYGTEYRGPGITSSPADSNISQQRSCKALLYAEPPRRSCSSGVILLKPDLVMSRFLVWDRGPSWRFRSRNVEVLKRNHFCVPPGSTWPNGPICLPAISHDRPVSSPKTVHFGPGFVLWYCEIGKQLHNTIFRVCFAPIHFHGHQKDVNYQERKLEHYDLIYSYKQFMVHQNTTEQT